MYIASFSLNLSATDLGRFLSCRHCTALDMEVAQGLRPIPPVYPDPFLDLLIERGLAHEKKYVELIKAARARGRFFAAFRLRSCGVRRGACQRSQVVWRLSQNSGDVPSRSARRRAVSAVTRMLEEAGRKVG
jgi:hypothetical protein